VTLHRRNPRRDANEPDIVQALQAAGCKVLRLSGAGVPDLACYRPTVGWRLAEVKTEKGQLKPRQRLWGPEIMVWRSIDDALAGMGLR
jgi:hypothetical protein